MGRRKFYCDGQAGISENPPSLVCLAEAVDLSDFERDVLLLAASVELDPSFGDLFAAASGNAAFRLPTFALAMTVLDDPAWDAMAPHRPLRYLNLIELRGADGIVSAPLSVPERVVNFIKGLNHLDAVLGALVTAFDVDPTVRPAVSQQGSTRNAGYSTMKNESPANRSSSNA